MKSAYVLERKLEQALDLLTEQNSACDAGMP